MADPYRVRVAGPLAPFARGFADELIGQGYTPLSAGLQVHLLAHLDRWLAARGLVVGDLGGEVVERFLEDRRGAGYTLHCSVQGLEPLLAYLSRLGVIAVPAPAAPVGPSAELVERYRRYLLTERGVGLTTARAYLDALGVFIAGRGIDDWGTLTAAEVTAFMVAECPRRSKRMAKELATAMRSFLGFLHMSGEINSSLRGAVPSIASWTLTGLPRRLERGQVQMLLDSCDRGSAIGARDYAILLLLSRLGLRRGEVAAMQLEDLDWRAGELLVRGKGHRRDRLPLPADVGDAVATYLRHGRPARCLDRGVFIRTKAPYRALSSTGVSTIVMLAGRRCGLDGVAAHRLRHTTASEMLAAGGSLEEIGQVLRHRRLATTAIYAKVDREALRSLARPWPLTVSGGAR